MNLSFTPNEEDEILNTTILNATIRDSDTGSVMYTVETPKYVGGTLTTTATRRNQISGSTRFAFRILWKGMKESLDGVKVVLDNRTLEEVPVGEVLGSARGSTTYGSVSIGGIEHRWKSKGMGSKVVLVGKDTKATVAQSHSRRRSSFFRKPRDMSLEVSEVVSHAVDIILLTFILVWKERQCERLKSVDMEYFHVNVPSDD